MASEEKQSIESMILSSIGKTMDEKKASSTWSILSLLLAHLALKLLQHGLEVLFDRYVFPTMTPASTQLLSSEVRSDNQLVARYQALMDTFKVHFDSLTQAPTDKNIHQLRVAIKKMRAVWRLLEHVSQGSFDKAPHFELFASLFQTAGNVREAQVNANLLSAYATTAGKSYMGHLSEVAIQAKQQLAEEAQQFDWDKLEQLNKNFERKARDISNEEIGRVASEYVNENVPLVLRPERRLKKLHPLRKKVRTLSEVLKYTDDRLDHPTQVEQLIAALNALIGDWHDLQVLGDSLEHSDMESGLLGRWRLALLLRRIKKDRREKEKEIHRVMDRSRKVLGD